MSSMFIEVTDLIGLDFDDQIIGVWDRDTFWPKHHALRKRHTSFRHHASRSLCFALSLGCSLGKTTILLECQL